jgi:hypothetical protein
LTLYFRFLHDHGGLSEWGMHWPPLLAGIALLLTGPSLLRRWVAFPTAVVWTVLIALSPLLVYLSKTARPYALTGWLTFIAIVAFRRWWREDPRRVRWASIYVIATCLAAYLHLVTLPYTLLPFAYYGASVLAHVFSRESRASALHELRRLIQLGLLTLLPLMLLLLPPMIIDWERLSAKAGTHTVTPESVYRSLLMLCGTPFPLICGVSLALAVAGARLMARRDRDLVAYLMVVMLGGTATMAASNADWIHHPGVLARYSIPALPFLFLFMAEGVAGLIARLKFDAAKIAAVSVGAFALLAAGPLPGFLYFPNQFIGHLRFEYDYDPAYNPYVQLVPPDPIPEFYRQLAALPPASLTLIEAPWRLESNFNPHPWYQEIHRQRVKIGLVTPVCGVRDFGEYPESPGMRFRQFAHLTAILRGETYSADYLIVHLRAWKLPPDAGVEWPDMVACLPAIEARLGPPRFRDDQIVVFDLKR